MELSNIEKTLSMRVMVLTLISRLGCLERDATQEDKEAGSKTGTMMKHLFSIAILTGLAAVVGPAGPGGKRGLSHGPQYRRQPGQQGRHLHYLQDARWRAVAQ